MPPPTAFKFVMANATDSRGVRVGVKNGGCAA